MILISEGRGARTREEYRGSRWRRPFESTKLLFQFNGGFLCPVDFSITENKSGKAPRSRQRKLRNRSGLETVAVGIFRERSRTESGPLPFFLFFFSLLSIDRKIKRNNIDRRRALWTSQSSFVAAKFQLSGDGLSID